MALAKINTETAIVAVAKDNELKITCLRMMVFLFDVFDSPHMALEELASDEDEDLISIAAELQGWQLHGRRLIHALGGEGNFRPEELWVRFRGELMKSKYHAEATAAD